MRASSSPDPTHDIGTSPDASTDVAPASDDQGLGSGETWPNYRALSEEPAWVQAVAQCVYDHESRTAGLYTAVNPAGYYGAAQWLDSTWYVVTGLPGHASDYSPTVQNDAFATLYNRGAGASHWPGTIGAC